MLHTVNKSPFQTRTLESCLAHARKDSALLLIEDGVYAAGSGTPLESKLQKAMENVAIYALGPDLEARGLTQEQVIPGIRTVDYAGFVNLVVEHGIVQAWL